MWSFAEQCLYHLHQSEEFPINNVIFQEGFTQKKNTLEEKNFSLILIPQREYDSTVYHIVSVILCTNIWLAT